MRFLLKIGLFLVICNLGGAGLAAQIGVANLGPSGVAPTSLPSTPLAAIQSRAQQRGMRVLTIRWDGVLHQNWAVLEDVAHPERPLWSELTEPVEPLLEASLGLTSSLRPTAPQIPVSPPKPIVVHYGDRVKLFRIEQNVRLEMYATTEGAAAVGDEVKLRLPSSGGNGDSGWRVVGVVRSPRDVEMEQ